MQLSTRGRYAVRAMMEMAENYESGLIQLKEIARRQEISEKYLEQIMAALRRNGHVYTQKGSSGGYRLSRPPGEITLLEIIESAEGSVAPVECVDAPERCYRDVICADTCAVRGVWARLKGAVSRELASINLAELAEEQRRCSFKN